jgi:diguanylate cyclase (GGDEF)-like protein
VKDKRQFEVIESRQLDHLRVFHEVARSLTSSLELEHILLAIMEKMAQFFGPERWSLLMVDEAANQLYYAIAVGEDSESLRGLHVPLGEGVAGWVAATGNPLVVPDVSLDPQWSAFSKAHPELRIQSIACIPIRSGTRTLGVIQLLNSKLDLLSEYSISFLRILCDYAAIAIQNAHFMTRIQELSITDDCTGLFNARHLFTLLQEQIALGEKPPKSQFSLLFIDLDRFKNINDTHGHLVGSRLLAEVGNRYGGDEFVALLPGMDKDAALVATTQLWEQLRAEEFLGGEGLALHISGSFGLATFPEDGQTMQALIRSADTMMYDAKKTRDNIAVAGIGLVSDRPNLTSRHQPSTMAAASLKPIHR